jgi:hypothetical protein
MSSVGGPLAVGLFRNKTVLAPCPPGGRPHLDGKVGGGLLGVGPPQDQWTRGGGARVPGGAWTDRADSRGSGAATWGTKTLGTWADQADQMTERLRKGGQMKENIKPRSECVGQKIRDSINPVD